MSKLNIQNDLFLARQEIDRLIKFLQEEGYIRLFKSLVSNFGVSKVDSDINFDNFKVELGTTLGTIKIANDSWAIDENVDIIYQNPIDNIAITDDSNWYWVKISYQTSNIEEGKINLAADGDATGIGTAFSEILRDQNNYPVKVNFPDSVLNTGDYQVTSVLSDTSVKLAGTTGFIAENDLNYQVVGSYTPGINPVGSDRLPYPYDSCDITLVLETVLDTPPAKTAGTEFYIARVRNASSTVTVQDKRIELFMNDGWTEPTLGTGFTNVVGQEVGYRKNSIGEVEVRGSFTVLTANVGDTVFTLPTGFLPEYKIQGIYGLADNSILSPIYVQVTGEVNPGVNFSDSQANEIVSLRFKKA